MRLIAHRGLMEGPNKLLENDPVQIQCAINLGFDCEIDFWLINNEFYLGHDYAQYKINESFLNNNKFWIHAKNLDALHYLLTTPYNYFWHQEDDFTLTSHRYIWAYPGKELKSNSIMVMPEWNTLEIDINNLDCYGICSDYVSRLNKYKSSII